MPGNFSLIWKMWCAISGHL